VQQCLRMHHAQSCLCVQTQVICTAGWFCRMLLLVSWLCLRQTADCCSLTRGRTFAIAPVVFPSKVALLPRGMQYGTCQPVTGCRDACLVTDWFAECKDSQTLCYNSIKCGILLAFAPVRGSSCREQHDAYTLDWMVRGQALHSCYLQHSRAFVPVIPLNFSCSNSTTIACQYA
jgi:hypothetical protein